MTDPVRWISPQKRHVILGLALTVCLLPARAQEEIYLPPSMNDETIEFVLGNVGFVLLHEVAHLIIGEFDVPVLGPEEEAADYLAAVSLLRGVELDRELNNRAEAYLLAAEDALLAAWQEGSESGAALPYWDNHALDIQRFYQVACLIYGSDPERFKDIPARIRMPTGRAAGCPYEFERALRSVLWVADTYGRQAGDPPGSPVAISYENPTTIASRQLLPEVQSAGILEAVADRLQARFALPRPVEFTMANCRQAQSAWLADEGKLVICYQMLDTLFQLSSRQHAEGRRSILETG